MTIGGLPAEQQPDIRSETCAETDICGLAESVGLRPARDQMRETRFPAAGRVEKYGKGIRPGEAQTRNADVKILRVVVAEEATAEMGAAINRAKAIHRVGGKGQWAAAAVEVEELRTVVGSYRIVRVDGHDLERTVVKESFRVRGAVAEVGFLAVLEPVGVLVAELVDIGQPAVLLHFPPVGNPVRVAVAFAHQQARCGEVLIGARDRVCLSDVGIVAQKPRSDVAERVGVRISARGSGLQGVLAIGYAVPGVDKPGVVREGESCNCEVAGRVVGVGSGDKFIPVIHAVAVEVLKARITVFWITFAHHHGEAAAIVLFGKRCGCRAGGCWFGFRIRNDTDFQPPDHAALGELVKQRGYVGVRVVDWPRFGRERGNRGGLSVLHDVDFRRCEVFDHVDPCAVRHGLGNFALRIHEEVPARQIPVVAGFGRK